MENDLGARSKQAFESEVSAGVPREVRLGFRVMDICQFDPISGTVFVDFFLSAAWTDPSMVGMKAPHFRRTVEEYNQLWNPLLEVNNAFDLEQLLDDNSAWNFKSADTGAMIFTQRFKGTVTIEPDLRQFPFDVTSIVLSIGSKIMGKDKLVLSYNAAFGQDRVPIAHKLVEWHVAPKALLLTASKEAVSGKMYSHTNFTMVLYRKYMNYIYKYIAVLLMLSAWSWSVFWMPPTEYADRTNLVVTLFLAAVAFNFVISSQLPPVDYLTNLDKVIFAIFTTIFAAGLESFVVYQVSFNDPNAAVRVDEICRLVIPSLSVLASFFYPISSGLYSRLLIHRASIRKTGRVPQPALEDRSAVVKASSQTHASTMASKRLADPLTA